MYKITIIMQLKHVIEKIYTHSNVMNALNYGFKNVVLQKGKIFVKKTILTWNKPGFISNDKILTA